MPKKPCVSSEAELCAAFIEQFNAIDGWTCYPETAGFDILVVHEDGRQIGVEAKLKLNAKVADQILPGDWHSRYATPGPDHRLVIVGEITDHGISPTIWTQGKGSASWLKKGEIPGQWIAAENLPAFDKQHPDAYAKLLEASEVETA